MIWYGGSILTCKRKPFVVYYIHNQKRNGVLKMYEIYDEKGNPYTTVYNEEEADYIAFCIGGYVREI